MKFTINANVFMQSVKPAADIALKNIQIGEDKKPFKCAKMITIESNSNCLENRAYSGTASIIVKVDGTDGYLPDRYGVATVNAAEILECLKSFQPHDNLVVSFDEEQLTVGLESDKEVYNRLETVPGVITCPKTDKGSVQSCVVDKDYFVKGLEKVAYAMADEDKMWPYKCLVFESWKNAIRFTAGSGGRFASLHIDGFSKEISHETTKMVLPKSNIQNVIRILKDSDYPEVKIGTVDAAPHKCVPEQIVLENGNMIIALYGSEIFNKYPNTQRAIDYNHSYHITTHLNDWEPVIKAIKATYCCNENEIHNTNVIADLKRGNLLLKTNSVMQIQRKIGFIFGPYPNDSSDNMNILPWFTCNSKYLLEIIEKCCQYPTVTINFDDQAKLADIPEDKPKQMKPILITFPVTVNEDGTREKFSVFFTVSAKW